ncbi:hypothetical protein BC827DRAFT_1203195 [Russula dissimulans]|nr:hypothetical protein BC827DRAFT_1203195 [Russula dissimulans]
MDAKLKALKVADLKDICTRANIPTTTRSTKADLIAKILASQPAIDAYSTKYQQNDNTAPSSKPTASSNNDDTLIPPEIEWALEDPSPPVPVPAAVSPPSKINNSTMLAPAATKQQSEAVPPKATLGPNENPEISVSATATPADEELEKRKARAARFGIALVEPPKPKTRSAPAAPHKAAKTTDEPEKLRARAERFGAAKPEQTGATTAPAVGRKKRGTAVVEEVDLEEQERRRKRAERFGNPVVGAKA